MDFDPKALGFEMEESVDRAPASKEEVDPKALGFEMEDQTPAQLEALGFELEAPNPNINETVEQKLRRVAVQGLNEQIKDETRGAVGKAWDATVDTAKGVTYGAKKALGFIKEEGGQLKDELGSMTQAIHGEQILNKGADAVGALFHGLDWTFQKTNRIGGTVIAETTKIASKLLNDDSLDLIELSRKRDLEEGVTKPGEISFDAIFPVRLMEDIGTPLGQKPLEWAGQEFSKMDSKTSKEVGEVLKGLAPIAGVASGIGTSFLLDPLAVTKFGALTEAGIAADKAGTLTGGVARQIALGERSIMELRVANKTLGITNFGKVGEQSIAKASELLTKAELAKIKVPYTGTTFAPIQMLRKITTNSPFESVNIARQARLAEENGIHRWQENFFNEAWAKAKQLGADLEGADFKKDLYAYADAPSAYKGKTSVEVLEPMFNHLDQTLANEVALTRASGITVLEKNFDKQASLFVENIPGEASERYVPRGVMPSKLQQFSLSKKFKDAENAKAFVEGLEGSSQRGSGGAGSYQKLRNAKSRQAMNEAIEQATGIKDYFHDDILQAYAEKITQLKRDRMDKKFVQSTIAQFGTTDEGFMNRIEAAKARVAQAAAEGLPAASDDLLMANMTSAELSGELSEGARNKLASLAKISPDLEGAQDLKVPAMLQDYVGEVLHRPDLGTIASTALGFQNALKGFMFFNPGFHVRNQYETFIRGLAVDVGASDNVKAFTGMMKNKGPWGSKRLELFLERTQAQGLATPLEEGIETALGRRKSAAKVAFDANMLKGENPVRTMFSSFKEMGSTGKWKQFLADLRERGPNAVKDNPLFRFSSMMGAKGEAVTKYAYFNKLLDEGYNADVAIRKVNAHFMDYENIRTGTRKLQLVLPFSNYMIKNAESTLAILAQNPRNATIFGPSGAFQRAIENWAKWDPERTWKMKEQFGVWANDVTLLPVMPGQDDLDKEQDLVKRTMFNWFSMGGKDAQGKKINELEGATLWMKLPSNYHALQNMNPTKSFEMLGPLVKSAWAFMGIDPFTGDAFKDAKYMDLHDRVMRASEQFTGVVWPDRAIKIAQAALQQAMPEYEKHFANLGLPDTTAQFIFGSKDPTDSRRKKMVKNLTWLKALSTGGATQMDVDLGLRIQAKAKGMQDYARQALSSKAALADQSVRERILRKYDTMNSDLMQMLDVKSDYDNAVKRMKLAPTSEVEFADSLELEKEDASPKRNPGMESMLVNPDEGGLNEISPGLDRGPASRGIVLPDPNKEPSLFDRTSELMRKNLDPRGPVVLPTGRLPDDNYRAQQTSKVEKRIVQDLFQRKPELKKLFNEYELDILNSASAEGLSEDLDERLSQIIDPEKYQDVEGGDAAYEQREEELYRALPPKKQRAYYELKRKQHLLDEIAKRARKEANG